MAKRFVARVANPTPEHFVEAFVRTQTPVILTETGVTTGLVEPLTPSAMVNATAGRAFHFKASASGAHPDFRASAIKDMFAREALTFAEFFAHQANAAASERARYIFTGDEHYLWRVRGGEKATNPDFGALADVVKVPRYVPEERVYSVWTWFSSQGVRTWLHYDNNACHNLNLQVHGSKRCTLLPPETVSELEFFEPGGGIPAFNCSRVDVDKPEGRALIERLPHFEAHLEPGDLLFIPAHWIHTFTHEGEYNANVNFWWQPDVACEPGVHDNAVAERERRLPQRQYR